jgi:hypothetical protein
MKIFKLFFILLFVFIILTIVWLLGVFGHNFGSGSFISIPGLLLKMDKSKTCPQNYKKTVDNLSSKNSFNKLILDVSISLRNLVGMSKYDRASLQDELNKLCK